MRVGFVGLSTPLFYDYRHMASAAPSDLDDSPNPIIEGAFGAMMLYDEIWFACRSLCPENMRLLPFVKFLDEAGELPEVDPEWLPEPEDMFHPQAIQTFYDRRGDYEEIRRNAHVYWDAAADNHTHAIRVGRAKLGGCSTSLKNVAYDMLLAERLSHDVELITNSFTAKLFESEASARDRLVLSEVLVLDSVPQFLTPSGPYHPCIEDVREADYLRHFREWIVDESAAAGAHDISEVKAEVEAKLAESLEDVFLRYLDPSTGYMSAAKTVAGIGVDALVPGASALFDLMGQVSEERQRQGLRWQGFLVQARRIVSDV